jgi:hypothetical protein
VVSGIINRILRRSNLSSPHNTRAGFCIRGVWPCLNEKTASNLMFNFHLTLHCWRKSTTQHTKLLPHTITIRWCETSSTHETFSTHTPYTGATDRKKDSFNSLQPEPWLILNTAMEHLTNQMFSTTSNFTSFFTKTKTSKL